MNPINGSPNRRQQILEEATHLFASKGFEGASMRNIAKACYITEAAIYRHFTNKADLYEQVIIAKSAEHDIPQHLNSFDADWDLEEVLRGIAEHILSMASDDPALMRLMVNNSLERGSAVARVLFMEVRMPFINFLSQELTRRIHTGEIRDIDPMITSRCFVGMVMDCALNIRVFNRNSGMDLEARDVICNNVPIFALGLMKHIEPENQTAQPGKL